MLVRSLWKWPWNPCHHGRHLAGVAEDAVAEQDHVGHHKYNEDRCEGDDRFLDAPEVEHDQENYQSRDERHLECMVLIGRKLKMASPHEARDTVMVSM